MGFYAMMWCWNDGLTPSEEDLSVLGRGTGLCSPSIPMEGECRQQAVQEA